VGFRARLLVSCLASLATLACSSVTPWKGGRAGQRIGCDRVGRSVAGRARGRVIVRWLDRLQPGLGAGHVRARQDDTADRRVLERARKPDGANSSPPFVLDVAPPPSTPEVKRYELRPHLLLDGARAGYQALVLAVERRVVPVTPRLTIPDPGLAPAARPTGVEPARPKPDPRDQARTGPRYSYPAGEKSARHARRRQHKLAVGPARAARRPVTVRQPAPPPNGEQPAVVDGADKRCVRMCELPDV